MAATSATGWRRFRGELVRALWGSRTAGIVKFGGMRHWHEGARGRYRGGEVWLWRVCWASPGGTGVPVVAAGVPALVCGVQINTMQHLKSDHNDL
jgi:hypothetical protein